MKLCICKVLISFRNPFLIFYFSFSFNIIFAGDIGCFGAFLVFLFIYIIIYLINYKYDLAALVNIPADPFYKLKPVAHEAFSSTCFWDGRSGLEFGGMSESKWRHCRLSFWLACLIQKIGHLYFPAWSWDAFEWEQADKNFLKQASCAAAFRILQKLYSEWGELFE